MAAETPDFEALRAEFPVTERWVYLDIANKATLPRCAEAAAREFFEDMYEKAGKGAFSMERVEAARASVARLLGVPPRTLAFVKNTAEGLNFVAQGLDLQAGENVVMTEMDHPNQIFAFRNLEVRGVEVRWVRGREGCLPVEAFFEHIDGRTRVVAVSYVTFGNGYRVNLPELGKVCRERGSLLVVDGIQGVGILRAPLPSLGADAVVSGGHKGMLGLNGTGILYCREDLIPRIHPQFVGRAGMVPEKGARNEFDLSPDARRFEYGNHNYLGIQVMRRSAEFLSEIGLEPIEERVRSLTTSLMDGLERRGKKIRTPRRWEERAAIVSIEDPDAAGTKARLREKNIVVSARDGALRISPHFYNNEEDIERLIEAL